jgi:CubicO group peptidase (beta-lactamase class C family)
MESPGWVTAEVRFRSWRRPFDGAEKFNDPHAGSWQAVGMRFSRLHDAMAARVDRGEFPGIVWLLAREDDVEVDAIGATAFGGEVPMRRDTIFRIASMTKPIVAAATMILAEDDVIDLEEPVARRLPGAGRPAGPGPDRRPARRDGPAAAAGDDRGPADVPDGLRPDH